MDLGVLIRNSKNVLNSSIDVTRWGGRVLQLQNALVLTTMMIGEFSSDANCVSIYTAAFNPD